MNNNYLTIPNDARLSTLTTVGQLTFDYVSLVNSDVSNEKERALILVKLSNKETLTAGGFESVTQWAETVGVNLNKATVSKSNKAVGRFHDTEEHIANFWNVYSLSQLEEMSAYSDEFIATCDIAPNMSAKSIREALKRKSGMIDVKSTETKTEEVKTEDAKTDDAKTEGVKTEDAKTEEKKPTPPKNSTAVKNLNDAIEILRTRTLEKGEAVNIARSKDGKTFTIVFIKA